MGRSPDHLTLNLVLVKYMILLFVIETNES